GEPVRELDDADSFEQRRSGHHAVSVSSIEGSQSTVRMPFSTSSPASRESFRIAGSTRSRRSSATVGASSRESSGSPHRSRTYRASPREGGRSDSTSPASGRFGTVGS